MKSPPYPIARNAIVKSDASRRPSGSTRVASQRSLRLTERGFFLHIGQSHKKRGGGENRFEPRLTFAGRGFWRLWERMNVFPLSLRKTEFSAVQGS